MDAKSKLFAVSSSLAIVIGLAANPGPASAQQAPTAARVEEVVVTGSRIAKQDLVSDSPIVTVGRQDIQQAGVPTIGEVLNRLPQLAPSATTSNFGTVQLSQAGISNVNLRGLGPPRNLILVDGRRLQPSTPFGVIDINSIPDSVIESTEIITGGASAVYGSDAMSGVVNLKLRHRFEGLELQADGGMTTRRDGGSLKTSLTYGANLDENRGNILLSLGYFNSDGIAARSSRPWFGPGSTLGASVSPILTGGRLPFAGNPANLYPQSALDALFARYGYGPSAALGGIGANGRPTSTEPLYNNADGTLAYSGSGPREPANVKPIPDPFAAGGVDTFIFQPTGTVTETPYPQFVQHLGVGGTVKWNLENNLPLTVPMTRYSMFAAGSYKLTDNIELYSQATAVSTKVKMHLFLTTNGGAGTPTIMIPADNAFIPADLKGLLNARPFPSAMFAWQSSIPTNPNDIINDYTLWQGQVGARGHLPVKDWTYDGYFGYGETHRKETTTNLWDIAAVEGLLNHRNAAGVNDGGAGLCAGGLNLFPQQALSAQCQQLIRRDAKNDSDFTQLVGEVNFQGALFDLPAGQLRFAAGADYRRNRFTFTPDSGLVANPAIYDAIPALGGRACPRTVNGTPVPAAAEGAYNACIYPNGVTELLGILSGATTPTHGVVDVTEFYGELSIPVLANLPLVKALTVDLAARRSDYNTVGAVNTYKADGNWQINDWIRLRGGYQRAIRAPSLGELFSPNQAGSIGIGLPSQGAGDPCDATNTLLRGANGARIIALCAQQGIDARTFQDDHTLVSSLTAGNPNLTEETGDSFTGGVVLRSPFDAPLLSHATLTVDYFDIRIKNAIGLITGPLAVQSCYNLNGFNPNYDPNNFYCGLIQRDPSKLLVNVVTPTQNLASYRTSGYDVAFNWQAGLEDLGLPAPGTVGLSSIVTIVDKFAIQNLPGSAFLDFNGTIGADPLGTINIAHPKLKAATNVTYGVGPVNVGLRWRYIDSMTNSNCVGVATCTQLGVASISYFDLFGRWEINDRIQVRASVSNLFDKAPPAWSGIGATDPATYDVVGRSFLVGLTAKF